jgi:molybdate transport system substrate-binding protein
MRRLLSALAFLLSLACGHEQTPAVVDVAAAASLQDALRLVGSAYEAKTGQTVRFNFAGSNILARQIRAGAPADVFLSADEKQGNSVPAIVRRSLLTNTLVVVANAPVTDLRTLSRIAIGDPSAVPAGVYAKAALQRLGLWDPLLPKLVPMENVRAALAAVDGGSVDAAIVYRTDALLAKHAKIVMTLDAPRIVYPAVLLRERGRRFYEFVQGAEAAAIFKRFGFATLP